MKIPCFVVKQGKSVSLGQHRIMWQELSTRDFAPGESLESAGILDVFPTFQTARVGQKIRRRPQLPLCGVALKVDVSEIIDTRYKIKGKGTKPKNESTPRKARRERVLRGRAALASGVRHSAPPPKPTSLGTFLFGDKKVPRRRHQRISSGFVPCTIS